MVSKYGKVKHTFIIGLCFMSCILAGCTTILSEPRGLNEVEERLAEVSPNESFTFKEVERREGIPKHDTYYFESNERDFTIKVYSAVAQDELQGVKLPLYYKYIYINYPGVVRQLYYDEVENIIETSGLYESKKQYEWTTEDLEHLSSVPWRTYVIDDVSDIDKVVSIISRISEIYSEEIKYNGEEWTKENPLIDMNVYWGDEEAREEHNTIFLANFYIDGTASYEEIDEQVRNAYREKIEEAAEETETALDENELYEQFIEGTISDVNGNNCCYAKNDPYYDEYIDLEWAVFDLNGDGINELIPRLYGSYTSELYSCSDGEIITSSNELFGSEGGFVNTKNQLVATDCSHANRNQYLISEFTGKENVNVVLFFAKWWEDDNNPDDAEYVKYEGSDYWDIGYEDYTLITKEEYEDLLQEYTQENEEIIFIKR